MVNPNNKPPPNDKDKDKKDKKGDKDKKGLIDVKDKDKDKEQVESKKYELRSDDPKNKKLQDWNVFLDILEKKYQPINPKETSPNPTTPKTPITPDVESNSNSSDDPDYKGTDNEEELCLCPECEKCEECDICYHGEEEDADDESEEENDNDDINKFISSVLFSSTLDKLLNGKGSGSNSGSGTELMFLMPGNSSSFSISNSRPGFEGITERKRGASMSLNNDLKRQKMTAIDREYKEFLTTKEKDDYEYFCDLELEQKTKILAEEKLVKELSNDKQPLRMKVINSTLPPLIKGEIIRKLASSKCGFGGNPKLMDWVEHIMRVPWSVYYPMPITLSDSSNKIGQYMTSIYSRMDQAVCGHNETKCHIMQIIGKWITNPIAVGNCLALQGPMGVGKTTLVKEGLAPALGRPFNFISLGGATDASFLEGHSFTYEGSIPGQMVEVIQRSKCMNPIIYFDELDKISKSHRGEEIANLLIHITDTQQNDKFHDKYFGNIDIDLSKVFFVFSYNHDENVPPILRDRLQVVRVKGYNSTQKSKIAIEYMFPRFCKDMGFLKDELIINEDVINYIINDFAGKEEGVRNLGRSLETVVSRLNVLRLVQKSDIPETSEFLDKLPFKAKKIPLITNNFLITRDIIDNILDKPKVDTSFHHMYL